VISRPEVDALQLSRSRLVLEDREERESPRMDESAPDRTAPDGALAPLIAIIGCDGSGKSTVGAQMLVWASGYGPAATAHLGKQSGNLGRALTRIPVVGPGIGRVIRRNVVGVRQRRDRNRTPRLLPALVISAFTVRRVLRFRRMLALRQQGRIVVSDRYPQLELPHTYDCPGMSADAEGNRVVRWLAQREQKAFEWMTSHRPDLVIRLHVDLDTACERKPDHRREALREKIASTPLLRFHGAPIVEIDAARPLEAVLADARGAVSRMLEARGYTRQA